ncbi:hypothetical protein AOLI_G00301190 [Acnodon oligacanthus]
MLCCDWPVRHGTARKYLLLANHSAGRRDSPEYGWRTYRLLQRHLLDAIGSFQTQFWKNLWPLRCLATKAYGQGSSWFFYEAEVAVLFRSFQNAALLKVERKKSTEKLGAEGQTSFGCAFNAFRVINNTKVHFRRKNKKEIFHLKKPCKWTGVSGPVRSTSKLCSLLQQNHNILSN